MIVYYTDGSTAPTNPGPGGYAVIRCPDGRLEAMEPHILGSEPGMTTNIRMEGRAILDALKDSAGAPCEIRTDSLFWINVLTEWITNWRKKQFKNVKNIDLVVELDRWYKISKAKLVHVRGHRGEVGNELADVWANKAREGVRL